MGAIASQITRLTIVYSIVYSDADQRKHQSSASLAFVWGIHRGRWIPRTNDLYAENISIWWRHHVVIIILQCICMDISRFNAARSKKGPESAILHSRAINDSSQSGPVQHYSDAIMSAMASQITGVSTVYSAVCSTADQRKHQTPVNSPHKGPVMRKMFPYDDVIMHNGGGGLGKGMIQLHHDRNTVRCRYNAVNFLKFSRREGDVWGVFYEYKTLIYFLYQSL